MAYNSEDPCNLLGLTLAHVFNGFALLASLSSVKDKGGDIEGQPGLGLSGQIISALAIPMKLVGYLALVNFIALSNPLFNLFLSPYLTPITDLFTSLYTFSGVIANLALAMIVNVGFANAYSREGPSKSAAISVMPMIKISGYLSLIMALVGFILFDMKAGNPFW